VSHRNFDCCSRIFSAVDWSRLVTLECECMGYWTITHCRCSVARWATKVVREISRGGLVRSLFHKLASSTRWPWFCTRSEKFQAKQSLKNLFIFSFSSKHFRIISAPPLTYKSWHVALNRNTTVVVVVVVVVFVVVELSWVTADVTASFDYTSGHVGHFVILITCILLWACFSIQQAPVVVTRILAINLPSGVSPRIFYSACQTTDYIMLVYGHYERHQERNRFAGALSSTYTPYFWTCLRKLMSQIENRWSVLYASHCTCLSQIRQLRCTTAIY